MILPPATKVIRLPRSGLFARKPDKPKQSAWEGYKPMPNGTRSQASPIESAHAYDNPTIKPKEFLLAVMRDQTVPLAQRIEAAGKALPLCPFAQAPPSDPGYTRQIPSVLQ
jgi:hypothetical protein